MFAKTKKTLVASLTSHHKGESGTEKRSRKEANKQAKKAAKKQKKQKKQAKEQPSDEPTQASDEPSTEQIVQIYENIDAIANIIHGGDSQLTLQPVEDTEDTETADEVYCSHVPQMQNSVEELRSVAVDGESGPSNEDVDFDRKYGPQISGIYDDIDEVGRLVREKRRLFKGPVGMSVSSPNLAPNPIDTIAEEADEDPTPPSPKIHRSGFLNRKRATTILPPKAPKRKLSFDLFSRPKKPTTQMVISGPIGPVTHTGIGSNPLERTTNIPISSPVGPVKYTGIGSNPLERTTNVTISSPIGPVRYTGIGSNPLERTTNVQISNPVGPVRYTGIGSNPLERTTNVPISSPVGPVRYTGSAVHTPERVETPNDHSGDAEGVSSPATTLADAAYIEERITYLQKKASEQTAVETANLKNGDKSSSLSKSKTMFLNAKQAVVRRFSSNAEKEAKLKAKENSSPIETSSFDPNSENRINRRVAEGKNLGDPKVQYLTGDGRIPRKPLPAYRSTESLRPTSPDDPFLDKTGMDGYVRSSYSQSSPHIDLSPHKNKQASAGIDRVPPPPMPKFSRTVSGLAQHSQVDIFSSNHLDTQSNPHIDLSSHKNKQASTRIANAPPPPMPKFSRTVSGLAQHSQVDIFSSSHLDAQSNPHIDLSPHKNKQASTRIDSNPPRPMPKFSRTVSGLAQHSQVDIFSSSPLDHSTPRTRLQPQINTDDPRPTVTDIDSVDWAEFYSHQSEFHREVEAKKQKSPAREPRTSSLPTTTLSHPPRNRLVKPAKRSRIPRPVHSGKGPLPSERKASSSLPYNFARRAEMSVDELQTDVSAYQIGGRRAKR